MVKLYEGLKLKPFLNLQSRVWKGKKKETEKERDGGLREANSCLIYNKLGHNFLLNCAQVSYSYDQMCWKDMNHGLHSRFDIIEISAIFFLHTCAA